MTDLGGRVLGEPASQGAFEIAAGCGMTGEANGHRGMDRQQQRSAADQRERRTAETRLPTRMRDDQDSPHDEEDEQRPYPVKLAGKTWPVRVDTVNLGSTAYRVVQPERPPRHSALYSGYLGWELAVDRRASIEIAAAWWLAARSRHTLVYLPLRASGSTCGSERYGQRLDLVLGHHSLQFPTSRWKQVRARLGSGSPQSVELPEDGFPKFGMEAHQRITHREFKDHLNWSVAADTLFVVGSRHGFDLQADEIRRFAEECRAHLAADPTTHCCAEIEVGEPWRCRPRRNQFSVLHMQACNQHW